MYGQKERVELAENVTTNGLNQIARLLDKVGDKDPKVGKGMSLLQPYLTGMAGKEMKAGDILSTLQSFLRQYPRTLPKHPWTWRHLESERARYNGIWILLFIPVVLAGFLAIADLIFSGAWIDTSGLISLVVLTIVAWWNIGARIKTRDSYEMGTHWGKQKETRAIAYITLVISGVIIGLFALKLSTYGLPWYLAVTFGGVLALNLYLWRFLRIWNDQMWHVSGYYEEQSEIMIKILRLAHDSIDTLVSNGRIANILQEELVRYALYDSDVRIARDRIEAEYPIHLKSAEAENVVN